jgi:hypothetical protein
VERARLGVGKLLAAAPILLLSLSAQAGQGAAAWDDQHMRSNFAHYLDDRSPRPAIQGLDRDGRIAREPAAAPATQVPELLLKISPHEWQPGGPRSVPGGASASSSLSASGFSWSNDASVPERSSGVRNQTSSPGISHRATNR